MQRLEAAAAQLDQLSASYVALDSAFHIAVDGLPLSPTERTWLDAQHFEVMVMVGDMVETVARVTAGLRSRARRRARKRPSRAKADGPRRIRLRDE